MRILIIDDEIAVANFLAEAVKVQGHEAVVAQGGAEGLALLSERHPDAVFLDIVMPEMSGIEVLRRIREVDQALPVIVITGRAEPGEIDEARRLGITDVIEKPFVLNQTHQALKNLESKKR